MAAPPLVTVAELGRIIRRSRQTVYEMVHSGALPFEPVAGCGVMQFRRTDIEAWLGCSIDLEAAS